jgi:hypothetical protein
MHAGIVLHEQFAMCQVVDGRLPLMIIINGPSVFDAVKRFP